MKKIVFIISVLLQSFVAFAQYQNGDSIPVKIDGIWYTLNVRVMSADLTRAIKKDLPEDVVIPETLVWQHNDYRVRTIRASAFMGCKIKSVVVPASVEKIGDGAFSFCKQLTSVTFLGMPQIGQSIFMASKEMKELNLAKRYTIYGISDNIRINYLDEQLLAAKENAQKSNPLVTAPAVTPSVQPVESDVDKNIPLGKQGNDHTFAVIIANENYRNVAQVQYAINDGQVFGKYCERTLGLPKSNIHFVQDATLNDLRLQVEWLRDIIVAYDGDVKIIFYYAGHGIPDEKSKSAYLLPTDGVGNKVSTGYSLSYLYRALGLQTTNKQPQITIFLDACFSGSTRSNQMLSAARGVAIQVKEGVPMGNMIVLTAASGDETAYPNQQEQHGMFTYYLLKKLQESQGKATIQELSDFVTSNVRQQSVVQNGKSQTPTLIPSPAAVDWQKWSLR